MFNKIINSIKKWTVQQYAIIVLLAFGVSMIVTGIAGIADIGGTNDSGDLMIVGFADIGDLADVNDSAPNDDDLLTWDTGTSKWIPEAGGGSEGAETRLTVCYNGMCDYTKPSSALAAVSGASGTKTYTVEIYGAVEDDTAIALKSNVNVIGYDATVTSTLDNYAVTAASITNCNVSNIEFVQSGVKSNWDGVIAVSGTTDDTFVVDNCTFTNDGTEATGLSGAFINGTAAPVFRDCEFTGGAGTSGHGVLAEGTSSATFYMCQATSGNTAAAVSAWKFDEAAGADLYDCKGTVASLSTGAGYNYGGTSGTITAINSTGEVLGSAGVAITISGGIVHISGGHYDGNDTNALEFTGGAVSSGSISVRNATLVSTNNALYCDSDATTLPVYNCVIDGAVSNVETFDLITGVQNHYIFDSELAEDHSYSGIPIVGTAGEDIDFGEACYLNTDGDWNLCCNSSGTIAATSIFAVAVTDSLDTTSLTLVPDGYVRDDSRYTHTTGRPVWVSGTPGAVDDTSTTTPGEWLIHAGHQSENSGTIKVHPVWIPMVVAS